VVATVLVLLPLVYLVVRATERGWSGVEATLWRSRTLELTLRSLELAAVVTVLCLVIGTGMAWLVTRTDLPGRRTLRVLVGLPLALPSYVAAWSWIGWRSDLAGRTGAVVVLTTISYPYVYLSVLGALRRSDPALEEVARSLGYSPWSVFWRVTLPQVRLAATGGGLLVGLYALSDFGAVATMRYEVLTHVIYRSYNSSFDRTPPAVLGCVLAVLALMIVLVESRTRRHRVAKVGAGTPRAQPVVSLGWARWPALVLPAGLLLVSLGIPAWGMREWFLRAPAWPDGEVYGNAVVNTLQAGALGALAVVVLAFPVAILTLRHAGWLSRTAVGAAYAGHALPGIVVGLSLVFFGIRYARPIYQEMPMLVLGYVVLFLSLGLAGMIGALAQVPPVLEDVARSLGRGPMAVWRTVTLRIAAPGVGAAATLVFLTIMKELPATLFLRPSGFDTLATKLWSHVSGLSYAAAAPYAVTIVVLAALPTALLTAAGERRVRR
jgi:iron(III) transport system permease protein